MYKQSKLLNDPKRKTDPYANFCKLHPNSVTRLGSLRKLIQQLGYIFLPAEECITGLFRLNLQVPYLLLYMNRKLNNVFYYIAPRCSPNINRLKIELRTGLHITDCS